MEGNLFLHKGFFKGFKSYFGKIQEPYFILYTSVKKSKKKSSQGQNHKEYLKLQLNSECVEVYPITLNQTDFVVIVNSQTKYKLRALSEFNRIQWL